MKEEIFNKIIELSKTDGSCSCRILTISDQNEQWLIPMLLNHFEDCPIFNQELLEIKKIETCTHEFGEGYINYQDEFDEICQDIVEVHIYYDNINITKYVTGEYELPGCPSPKDGGILGLPYKKLKPNIVEEYCIEVIRSEFEDYAKNDCEEYSEESVCMVAEDIEYRLAEKLKEEIKENIFYIFEYNNFNDFDIDAAIPYDKADKEYQEYLIKNGYR